MMDLAASQGHCSWKRRPPFRDCFTRKGGGDHMISYASMYTLNESPNANIHEEEKDSLIEDRGLFLCLIATVIICLPPRP
jgi:hypothetical protein